MKYEYFENKIGILGQTLLLLHQIFEQFGNLYLQNEEVSDAQFCQLYMENIYVLLLK